MFALYLGGNQLTKLPAKLPPTLTHLELGPNPLGPLPGDVFGGLEKLSTLDLTSTGIRTLPEELTQLPIRELFLNENLELDFDQVLSIAARIPTLRWLGLGSCGLESVPDGVAALAQIERLYLNGNVLRELPQSLAAMELELLGAQHNRIETIPDALEPKVRTIYFAGKGSDVLETVQLDSRVKAALLAFAGQGSPLAAKWRLHVEIGPNGLPFLPISPRWHPVIGAGERALAVEALDVVDVVVSKLKRFRANDRSDIEAMIDRDLVPHAELLERFRSAVDAFSGDARAEELPRYARASRVTLSCSWSPADRLIRGKLRRSPLWH